LYPEYSVAIPHSAVIKAPLAYAMARNDPEMLLFINSWIDLKKKNKTTDKLYDYWILDKDAKEKQPRWSVMRDVLHWEK
jgi:ABC-type amino acid transport substrate-binding protein